MRAKALTFTSKMPEITKINAEVSDKGLHKTSDKILFMTDSLNLYQL
jgi:hypothetical protein